MRHAEHRSVSATQGIPASIRRFINGYFRPYNYIQTCNAGNIRSTQHPEILNIQPPEQCFRLLKWARIYNLIGAYIISRETFAANNICTRRKTITRRHNWCAESMGLCRYIAKTPSNQANPLGSGGVRHAFCPQYASDTSGQLLFYHIMIFISSVSRWFNDLSLNFYCVFTMSLAVKHFVKYIF